MSEREMQLSLGQSRGGGSSHPSARGMQHDSGGSAVVNAWGFAYKTNAIWAKDSIGLGYWLRNQHEHLIIATRGKMPPPAHARSSVFHGASGRHSEKPASVREWICDAYPHVGRIELFARGAAPGWPVWGHEAPASMPRCSEPSRDAR